MTCEDDSMPVNPLPGIDGKRVRDLLFQIRNDLANVRSSFSIPVDRYNAYIRWANEAARKLRGQLSPADLDRLVLTRRYWLLQSIPSPIVEPVGQLVDTEVDDRAATLDDTMRELDRQIERWSREGTLVVADTSVYVTHPDKLEEMDFASLLGPGGDLIRVLVPIIVVDELDGLKRVKDRDLRWRAGYTLGVLDRVLVSPLEAAVLRPPGSSLPNSADPSAREITIELVFDPPGHVRLPINDDEIIDRTLAIEALAARKVTLLTYDTGQATRARAAGLTVLRLQQPAEDDPAS